MLTVNCRTIVRKDQEATNGVVHMIDSLLDPGAVLSRDVSEIVTTVGKQQSTTIIVQLVEISIVLLEFIGWAVLCASQSHGRIGFLQ